MQEQNHLKYGWRLRKQLLVNSELGGERRGNDLDRWVQCARPSSRQPTERSLNRRDGHGHKHIQNFCSLYHIFSFLSYSFNSSVLYLVESVFPPNIYPSLRRMKNISLFLPGSLGTAATMHGQEVHDSSEGTNGHWWSSPC